MHRVGPYHIPFPYAPYPLQEHAMTALRDFLQSATESDAHVHASTSTSIAVLESPTGTGKSQMLLNSVLSHLFEPVGADGIDRDVREGEHSEVVEALPSPQQQEQPQPQPTTLEEVLKQRQYEEEVERLRRERKTRVRAQQRQLRQARKAMRLQQQQQQQAASSGNGRDAEESFLLAQDPVAWYMEQPGSIGGGESYSAASSSSLSTSSSSESENDDDEVDDDVDGAVEGSLATLVPLRKPKVYVASRTHTQLQQLMEDLQRTAFAAQPLRDRVHASSSTSERTPTRRLTAVHVAGRPHLCINARVLRKAGGGSEMLNHYCREAMQYERSKQGRLDRKQLQQQAHQQGVASSSSASGRDSNNANNTHSNAAATREDLRDIEEMEQGLRGAAAEEKGCVYCAETHLRALLDFLRSEQAAQHRADQQSTGYAINSRGSATISPSASLCTMERLRHLGKELQACPYLATRLLLRGADVAFIPYSYLLDEGQRAALLGGVTTNPATAAEAEAVGLDRTDAAVRSGGDGLAGEEGEAPPSSPSPRGISLGSVLYHRKQRVTATAAFHQRRKQQQQQQQQQQEKREEKGSSQRVCRTGVEEAEDEAWHVMARSAPPSVADDILVFDEAHNIADHCRTTSTVSLSPWHLQLMEGLLQAYLDRYEARLLTRNKQRLRELIRFADKLVGFCARAAASTTSPHVFPFHAFLFEAGIASVDVYALLVFLVDAQLLVKLQGFVGYCLDKEAEEEKEKESAPRRQTQLPQGTNAGGKRRRPSVLDWEEAVDERQRQRRFLDTLASDTATIEQGGWRSEQNTAGNAEPSSLLSAMQPPRISSLLRRHAPDATRQRVVVTDALHRLERLLSVLYICDGTSTRVIWTPANTTTSSSSSSSSSSSGRGVDAEVGEGVLKLIQLEPGTHTFAPLAQEAKAVVLAGGTMQPLAFTCGPLLPPNLAALTAAPRAAELPLRLISEGHVVPPTSVRVFTLATGPSNVRLEFSQHALQDAAASTRMVVEVGCTLLNLTRVLPPAGAICFFTSYDAMERMVEGLQNNGYYDQINAVKRIFHETRGGKQGSATAASGGGVVAMLQEYQSWIYNGAAAPAAAGKTGDRRGALLFAVMGGRLSEGINFADDLGRAVIVLGMPYANPTDVELQLTLHHIARTRLASGDAATQRERPTGSDAVSASATAAPFTSAAEWGLYMDAMMRTVNQCIGRCIRHSGDYAAILLLDARYGERADVRRRVSSWLQPSLHVCRTFGECFAGLRTFFSSVSS